ncbi:hypothetical protein BJ912DRAFT_1044619 [Pholiota molesta]|nr:hypothetical protein BJ912DRAFT_1044619 [Pholiota molesta]
MPFLNGFEALIVVKETERLRGVWKCLNRLVESRGDVFIDGKGVGSEVIHRESKQKVEKKNTTLGFPSLLQFAFPRKADMNEHYGYFTEDMRPIASNHAGEIRLIIYRINILDRKARISDPDASEDIERIATFIFKYRTIESRNDDSSCIKLRLVLFKRTKPGNDVSMQDDDEAVDLEISQLQGRLNMLYAKREKKEQLTQGSDTITIPISMRSNSDTSTIDFSKITHADKGYIDSASTYERELNSVHKLIDQRTDFIEKRRRATPTTRPPGQHFPGTVLHTNRTYIKEDAPIALDHLATVSFLVNSFEAATHLYRTAEFTIATSHILILARETHPFNVANRTVNHAPHSANAQQLQHAMRWQWARLLGYPLQVQPLVFNQSCAANVFLCYCPLNNLVAVGCAYAEAGLLSCHECERGGQD